MTILDPCRNPARRRAARHQVDQGQAAYHLARPVCPTAQSPPRAAKSLRKAQTAIREAGVDTFALVLQAALIAGDMIAEAGLSVQPKALPESSMTPTPPSRPSMRTTAAASSPAPK